MDATLPRRTRDYVGTMTNTDVWEDFELRADDVFVCTPPKCGTTWTQTIVRMLIAGQPDPSAYDNAISPWIDCGFRDRDEIVARLEAQGHRRCIKTHTPLDGIRYDPRATYIAVYRHPIDVHFSMRSHVENMTDDWMDHLFPDDDRAGFRMFVDNDGTETGTDELTLASVIGHFRSFRDYGHLPNIHFFHYAEMSRDLPGQIARLAGILGIEADAQEIAALAEAASFGAMKEHARNVSRAPGFTTVFKDYAGFFASGTSKKWEGRLEASDIEDYRRRIAELLPADERDWLETGEGSFGRDSADIGR